MTIINHQSPVADSSSGSMPVIDTLISGVHRGRIFTYSSIINVGASQTLNFLLKVPSTKNIHLRGFEVNTLVSESLKMWAFEAPVTTSDGTPLGTGINMNRTSAITPEMTFFATPTITSDGLNIWSKIQTSSKSAGGEGIAFPSEWIMRKGTNYLLRLQNTTSLAADTSLNFIWYEYS